jgi:arsenate reductase
VFSAGTKPSHVRPEAIAVMRELGIDISNQRSKSLDEFTGQQFDYFITVCDSAKESCPIFPGKPERIHWSFEVPAAIQGSEDERIAVVRKIRDQLHARLMVFVGEHPALAPYSPGNVAVEDAPKEIRQTARQPDEERHLLSGA